MMPKQSDPAARLEGSRWTPYLFVAPVALYLLAFQGYPLLQELLLGFTSTSLLSPADHTYVGLRNYVELIGTSEFQGALLITATYTVACVVLSIGLGLADGLRRMKIARRPTSSWLRWSCRRSPGHRRPAPTASGRTR
jgi:multiple sugar transport system permease protein